jgi:hypothetical protein
MTQTLVVAVYFVFRNQPSFASFPEAASSASFGALEDGTLLWKISIISTLLCEKKLHA